MARYRHRYQAIARCSRPICGILRPGVHQGAGYPRAGRLGRKLHSASRYGPWIATGQPRISCPTQFPVACVPLFSRSRMGRQKTNYCTLGGDSSPPHLMPRNPFAQLRGPMRGAVAPDECPIRPGGAMACTEGYLWYLNEPQAPLRNLTLILPSG